MTRIDYLLVVLAEECAELAQACSKAIRFGLNDDYTLQHPKEMIKREFNDVLAVMEILTTEGVFDALPLDREMITKKQMKIGQFIEYSEKVKGQLRWVQE